MPGAMRSQRFWPTFAVVFAVAAASRTAWLWLFASDLPFWDQWDAEGWLLYRPYQDESLTWTQLFSAHNEHRIFWSRLTALLLFVGNGQQWDNLVTASFSALFFSAIAAALAGLIARSSSARHRPVLIALVLLATCLPVGWENLISGFQIAFAWTMLFSLAALVIAASRPLSIQTSALLFFLCTAVLFTSASAPSAAIAAALVIACRWWSGESPLPSLALIPGLLMIAVIGVLLIPDTPHHEPLKAQNLAEFMQALLLTLSWPHFLSIPAGLPLWLLPLLWLPAMARRQALPARVLFALAISAWVLMQCVAIAYSRGHAMAFVPSRYLDIVVLGSISNVFLLLEWLSLRRSAVRPTVALASLVIVLSSAGILTAGFNGIDSLRRHAELSAIQTANLAAYVRHGDAGALAGKPHLHLPYPDPARLRMMLDDPHVRSMLPDSVRPLDEAEATGPESSEGSPRSSRPGRLSLLARSALEHSARFLALILFALLCVAIYRWLSRPTAGIRSDARGA